MGVSYMYVCSIDRNHPHTNTHAYIQVDALLDGSPAHKSYAYTYTYILTYIQVDAILEGSPAHKSGKIAKGDVLLSVKNEGAKVNIHAYIHTYT
jgi:hypothetical protein